MESHHIKLVTLLKKIPSTVDEAREFGDLIKCLYDIGSTYEDDRVSSFLIEANELVKRQKNLFTLIAFKNKWLADYCHQVLINKNTLTLNGFLKKIGRNFNESVMEGAETRKGGKIQRLTIVRTEDRATKKEDAWFVYKIYEQSITAKNRFADNKEVSIPISSLDHALRRVSVINTLDITTSTDIIISSHFSNIERYFPNAWNKKKTKFWPIWKRYIQDRLCNLAVVRRADISAPGTALLAMYSDTPFVPPGVAWCLKLDKEYSKFLTLWFNSIFSILQLLYYRKETRGAFLQLDQYVLEDLMVPDFTLLNTDEKVKLNDLFDATKNIKFPSILQQLTAHHSDRMDIDRLFMKLLGIPVSEIEHSLTRLYDSLAEEITILKQLMQGEPVGDEEIESTP
jgi:hypothetical protein